MKWFEKWVVVQHYSKRPRLFKVPGPSGFLIIFGWIQLGIAFVLIALVYSMLFSVVLAFSTAVILRVLSVLHYKREVDYWQEKYFDANQGDEIVEKGFYPFSATLYVDAIRRSPVGKPDDSVND